jgi:hypothetical protein
MGEVRLQQKGGAVPQGRLLSDRQSFSESLLQLTIDD